ncbi:Dabb family protein [Aquimarina sp. D1M17]|uniref:Dabb family protein n=1 Tax=Aquimarina acroporae TaxID=2937283 RepID=UPI0020BD5507|nr:Dabb family protein [Aquimarina acroporae]MCK8520516.1 Dabb family protein [Aquimarina acroporae]
MKPLFIILISLFSLSAMAQNETASNESADANKEKLIHTVFFWLNNPDNEGEREKFEKGVKTLLKECKFISSSNFGTPAGTKKRPVVDHSFTYCVVIKFASKEAHDNYQIDPVHTKFVDENKGLWSKVLVYDSTTSL